MSSLSNREALLTRVAEEDQDFFQDFFMSDDSEEEFSGFEEEDEDYDDVFVEPESSEDEDEDEEDEPSVWVRGSTAPTRLTFAKTPGPKNIGTPTTPLDYFKLFFTANIVTMIVTETNRYATQMGAAEWTPVDCDDIKTFFSMTICMGLLRQVDLKDYWCRAEPTYTPFFHTYISRNRFLAILRYLHLANNDIQQPRGHP